MIRRIQLLNGIALLAKKDQKLIQGGAKPCTIYCGHGLYCDCSDRCPERWEEFRCYSTKAPGDITPVDNL